VDHPKRRERKKEEWEGESKEDERGRDDEWVCGVVDLW
jgi:hypothetical protein